MTEKLDHLGRPALLMRGPRQSQLGRQRLEGAHALERGRVVAPDDQKVVHEDEDVNAAPSHPLPEHARHVLGDAAEPLRAQLVPEGQAAAPEEPPGRGVPHHQVAPRAQGRGHHPEAVAKIVLRRTRVGAVDRRRVEHGRQREGRGSDMSVRMNRIVLRSSPLIPVLQHDSPGMRRSARQSLLHHVLWHRLEMSRDDRAVALCSPAHEVLEAAEGVLPSLARSHRRARHQPARQPSPARERARRRRLILLRDVVRRVAVGLHDDSVTDEPHRLLGHTGRCPSLRIELRHGGPGDGGLPRLMRIDDVTGVARVHTAASLLVVEGVSRHARPLAHGQHAHVSSVVARAKVTQRSRRYTSRHGRGYQRLPPCELISRQTHDGHASASDTSSGSHRAGHRVRVRDADPHESVAPMQRRAGGEVRLRETRHRPHRRAPAHRTARKRDLVVRPGERVLQLAEVALADRPLERGRPRCSLDGIRSRLGDRRSARRLEGQPRGRRHTACTSHEMAHPRTRARPIRHVLVEGREQQAKAPSERRARRLPDSKSGIRRWDRLRHGDEGHVAYIETHRRRVLRQRAVLRRRTDDRETVAVAARDGSRPTEAIEPRVARVPSETATAAQQRPRST